MVKTLGKAQVLQVWRLKKILSEVEGRRGDVGGEKNGGVEKKEEEERCPSPPFL